MTTQVTIDPGWTINETIAAIPQTISVFNSFGVDTCCGGDETITASARDLGIDADVLIAALVEAASEVKAAR